jgi:hypothetical protein
MRGPLRAASLGVFHIGSGATIMGRPPRKSPTLGSRSRFARAIWLAFVLFIVLVAFAPAAASAKSANGSLRLRISGLVGRAPGRVVVNGPAGFKRAASRTLLLRRLGPGRYSIVVSPTLLHAEYHGAPPGSRLMPAVRTVRVRVSSGKTAVAVASYATVVSKKVVVLAAAPTRVTGPLSDPTAIVVPAAPAPRVGDILAQAPTASLPGGLFDVVTAITNSRGQTTVSLRAANLAQAFPDLQLHARTVLSPEPTSSFASQSLLSDPFAHSTDLNGIDFSLGRGPASCGLLTGNFAPTFAADISLNPFDLHATITLGVQGALNFDVASTAGMTCGLTIPGPVLSGWVPVFGVPVPVYGELDLAVNGTVSLGQDSNATLNANAQGGFSYQSGHMTPIFSAGVHGSAHIGCVTGTLGLLPTLEAGIGVKDPIAGNIHDDLGFGPQLSAHAGGWEVNTLAQLSAGISIGPLTGTLPATSHTFPGFSGGASGCGGSGGGRGGGAQVVVARRRKAQSHLPKKTKPGP